MIGINTDIMKVLFVVGLGNITINRKYRQTNVCNIACIFLSQYYCIVQY